MRITPLKEALQFLNIVRERSEGDPADRQQRGGKDQQHPQKEPAANPEEVQRAIEAFSSDEQARAAGITADLVSAGRELAVVLKDASGAVLRQLSGEEFLRMRDATRASAGRARGKILDQKL